MLADRDGSVDLSADASNAADMVTRRRLHNAAVAAFARHARTLSTREGEIPRGPGKWTPAQETAHLTLAYRAFAAAIKGGVQLGLRVPIERAVQLQQTVLPRVLAGGWFPRGAESPGEAMPREPITPLPFGVDELETAARELDDALATAFARDPTLRITHPYFGPMLLPDLVTFLTAHAEHHRSFLPERNTESTE